MECGCYILFLKDFCLLFSKLQEKMLHFETVARVRVNEKIKNKQTNKSKTYVRIRKKE